MVFLPISFKEAILGEKNSRQRDGRLQRLPVLHSIILTILLRHHGLDQVDYVSCSFVSLGIEWGMPLEKKLVGSQAIANRKTTLGSLT